MTIRPNLDTDGISKFLTSVGNKNIPSLSSLSPLSSLALITKFIWQSVLQYISPSNVDISEKISKWCLKKVLYRTLARPNF